MSDMNSVMTREGGMESRIIGKKIEDGGMMMSEQALIEENKLIENIGRRKSIIYHIMVLREQNEVPAIERRNTEINL